MKIFVLSIFVIFATIMAQLPSILGCGHGAGAPFFGSTLPGRAGRRRSLGERSVGSKGKP